MSDRGELRFPIRTDDYYGGNIELIRNELGPEYDWRDDRATYELQWRAFGGYGDVTIELDTDELRALIEALGELQAIEIKRDRGNWLGWPPTGVDAGVDAQRASRP